MEFNSEHSLLLHGNDSDRNLEERNRNIHHKSEIRLKLKNLQIHKTEKHSSVFSLERTLKGMIKKFNFEDERSHKEIEELIIQMIGKEHIPANATNLDESLVLLKIIFECHQASILSQINPKDPFFLVVISPLLSELLVFMNDCIIHYCLSTAISNVATEVPAASSHELMCFTHRTVRIFLILLKRISVNMGADKLSVSSIVEIELKKMGVMFGQLLQMTTTELPLDVKCNLGIGICYIFRIIKPDLTFHPHFVTVLYSPTFEKSNEGVVSFEDIFLLNSEDLDSGVSHFTESNSFHYENRVAPLAFLFGLLTVIGAKNGDDYFDLRMQRIGECLFRVDHGSKEALNLGSARLLEIWTDKLLESQRVPNSEISSLFSEAEFFVFSYLAGHIDAVKTCCRNIIKNLTLLYDRMEGPDQSSLIRSFIERILVKPQHVKWIALSCVTTSTSKSTCILEIDPQIPQSLLCSDRTMKNAASETYLSLMKHNSTQLESVNDWKKIWIEPLYETQKLSPNETNWAQKRGILNSILRHCSHASIHVLLDYVLERMNYLELDNTEDIISSTESSLLVLETIKLISEMNSEMKGRLLAQGGPTEYSRGFLPSELFQRWACKRSSQARLACFSLLVETKKTTEVINAADLESLKVVFKYNFSSQNPSFRQQFFSYFKKLLKRLRDSRNSLVRIRDSDNLRNYDEFFKWLWIFLTEDEGLFPGSNFGRRCQALEFLRELLQYFDPGVLGIPLMSHDHVWLFRWLYDSYEHNKKLAFPILQKLFVSSLSVNALGEVLLKEIFRLCESLQPPDTVTGRYLALFLIQQPNTMQEIWISREELLTQVLVKLQRMLDSIRADTLAEFSSRNQMYGYFRMLRMIFKESSGFDGKSNFYNPFSTKLLKLCLDFNELLLPVLGNAAPEGFLPGLPDSTQGSCHVVRSLHAQRLLVCSWRSMRDICLLLSDMCLVLSIEGEEISHYVWTFEEVELIGEHLLFLLKNVMHRGVFEQVFTGFKQLAYRLFKSPCAKLVQLPEKWLNESLDEELISTKCITRRSAGLPFIFQALLSPIENSNEEIFCKYVNLLFSKCEQVNSDYIRVHYTNVLRGLFKDANFSRGIMPFVPKGLKLAFTQLKSTNWNECNAGLMLYGAIIRRTFGPKLNLMTAPTFFRKFPEMYNFLLSEVTSCAHNVEQLKKGQDDLETSDAFTYQLLLLLSSFAKTGVVEYAPVKISQFVPYIYTCGGSQDFQVREVSAEALTPFLVQPTSKIVFITNVLRRYDNTTGNLSLIKPSNYIHRDLLQVLGVLRSISEEDLLSEIRESCLTIFNSDSLLWLSACPTIYETMAEICIYLNTKSIYTILQQKYDSRFSSVLNRSALPGLVSADIVLAQAEIVFVLRDHQSTANGSHVMYNWIVNKPIYFLTQLFRLLIEKHSWSTSSDQVVVVDALINRYLSEDYGYEAQTENEEVFLRMLGSIPGEVYDSWLDFVGNGNSEKLMNKLIKICEMDTGTNECKKRSMIVVGRLSLQSKSEILCEVQEKISEVLCTWCDPMYDVDIRLAAACAIPKIPFYKLKEFSVLQQSRVWFSILTLLSDDDESVRKEIGDKLENVNGPFCDRKAAELTMEAFLLNFGKFNVLEALVVLVGNVLRANILPLAEEEESPEDETLFCRSEMNAFTEPIILAKIFGEQIAKYHDIRASFRYHFVSTSLSPNLLQMYEFMSNRVLQQSPSQSVTLESLICELRVENQDISSTSFIVNGLSDGYLAFRCTCDYLLQILRIDATSNNLPP